MSELGFHGIQTLNRCEVRCEAVSETVLDPSNSRSIKYLPHFLPKRLALDWANKTFRGASMLNVPLEPGKKRWPNRYRPLLPRLGNASGQLDPFMVMVIVENVLPLQLDDFSVYMIRPDPSKRHYRNGGDQIWMPLDGSRHDLTDFSGRIDADLFGAFHGCELTVVGGIFFEPFTIAPLAPVKNSTNLSEHGIPVRCSSIPQTGFDIICRDLGYRLCMNRNQTLFGTQEAPPMNLAEGSVTTIEKLLFTPRHDFFSLDAGALSSSGILSHTPASAGFAGGGAGARGRLSGKRTEQRDGLPRVWVELCEVPV
jgi:hypothetical protein